MMCLISCRPLNHIQPRSTADWSGQEKPRPIKGNSGRNLTGMSSYGMIGNIRRHGNTSCIIPLPGKKTLCMCNVHLCMVSVCCIRRSATRNGTEPHSLQNTAEPTGLLSPCLSIHSQPSRREQALFRSAGTNFHGSHASPLISIHPVGNGLCPVPLAQTFMAPMPLHSFPSIP